MENTFANLVAFDWATAVREVSAQFKKWKPEILDSLHSTNPEVRSASIATLNEADCAEAHDSVANLAKDESPQVRGEVYEYLVDFGRPEDSQLLLSALRDQDHLFVASEALNRLCGGAGPILDEEDNDEEIRINTLAWEKILRERGYVA